ncbi:MAG: 50S ribosomal protein L25 [Patescibacteria group bacterium]|jgi:large subunit ribosomal protein L25
MENIKLEAEKRDKKENVKDLLKSGFIPGIVYGPHLKENKLVKIKANNLNKALAIAGESTLVDLFLGEEAEGKVLFKDTQRNPLSDNLSHIDLYEVDMNKEITSWLPLHFTGESKAIKEKGGVLIRSISEIEIKCLPGDLAGHIEVDISLLDDFNKSIKVHDLILPKGIKMTHETDDVVATVAEPKVEEEPIVATPAEGEVAAATTTTATKTEESTEKKAEKKAEKK